MTRIIIGNVIAFIASMLMVFIGLIKSKKKILVGQCLQFGLFAAGNICLGGYSGALTNLLSLVRNLICVKRGLALWMKIVFSALLIGLNLAVMQRDGTGFFNVLPWLPVVAGIIFTFFLTAKDEVTLKRVIIVTQLMWMVYDWSIQGYVNFIFDIITTLSTIIGIWRVRKDRKEKRQGD